MCHFFLIGLDLLYPQVQMEMEAEYNITACVFVFKETVTKFPSISFAYPKQPFGTKLNYTKI